MNRLLSLREYRLKLGKKWQDRYVPTKALDALYGNTVDPFFLSSPQLWQAGKQSTQKFINMYAHIDFLRPYFDVEPKEVRNRYVQVELGVRA